VTWTSTSVSAAMASPPLLEMSAKHRRFELRQRGVAASPETDVATRTAQVSECRTARSDCSLGRRNDVIDCAAVFDQVGRITCALWGTMNMGRWDRKSRRSPNATMLCTAAPGA
jgi:hypothetical protein